MLFTAIVGLGLTAVQLAGAAQVDKVQFQRDLVQQRNAAYKKVYDNEIRNANLRKARHAAQLNVAAIRQDKIMSDTSLKLRQEKNQALIEISAATAGVSGGSVDSAIRSSERDSVYDGKLRERQMEQQEEGLLAGIGNTQAAMLEIDEIELDLSKQPTIYNTLQRIDANDLANAGTVAEELWG